MFEEYAMLWGLGKNDNLPGQWLSAWGTTITMLDRGVFSGQLGTLSRSLFIPWHLLSPPLILPQTLTLS